MAKVGKKTCPALFSRDYIGIASTFGSRRRGQHQLIHRGHRQPKRTKSAIIASTSKTSALWQSCHTRELNRRAARELFKYAQMKLNADKIYATLLAYASHHNLAIFASRKKIPRNPSNGKCRFAIPMSITIRHPMSNGDSLFQRQ